MNDQLVPEYLPISCGVERVCGLGEDNKFVLINGKQEFAIATMDTTTKLNVDVIQNNYPHSELCGAGYEGLYASADANVLWVIQTRAIVGFDRENKKPFEVLFASDGNTSLVQTVIGDNANTIIGEVVDVGVKDGEPLGWLASYNYKSDTLEPPSKHFDTFLFHLGGDKFLWCETGESIYQNIKWHICNSNFTDIQHNKLTDELTKKQIATWGGLTPVNPKKRMMIGAISVGYDMNYFSIRWNHDMSEVKIEPIVLQIPQNGSMADPWYFSKDGTWLVATHSIYIPEEKNTRLFYHIDDKYPQGISLPVFGQETLYQQDGCFVNHSVYGPLYLDWSPEFANTLLVYRLNDVLKVLAGKAGIR